MADWVIIVNKDDITVVNDVTTKLQDVKAPMEEVWMKIEVRQNRLQDTLIKSQQFQDSLDDFLDKLTEFEERLSEEKPISAKLDVVRDQEKEHEQIHNDICQQEPIFEQLVKKAEDLIDTSEPGEEQEKIRDSLDEMKDRFKDLKEKSTDRQHRLEKVVPTAQKYEDDSSPFKTWLTDQEKKLEKLEPLTCDETTIGRQLKEVKVRAKFTFDWVGGGDYSCTYRCRISECLLDEHFGTAFHFSNEVTSLRILHRS